MKTIVIDTNLLVRLLARDDSVQWQIAANLLLTHQVVVLPTVLLEPEWVLRSVMHYSRERIATLFESLFRGESISLSQGKYVEDVVAAFASGMDFADAMHVCGCAPDQTFVTFDRDLVRLANKQLVHAKVELAV